MPQREINVNQRYREVTLPTSSGAECCLGQGRGSGRGGVTRIKVTEGLKINIPNVKGAVVHKKKINK